MWISSSLGISPSFLYPGSWFLFNDKAQEKRFEFKKGVICPRMGADFTKEEVDFIIKYFKD